MRDSSSARGIPTLVDKTPPSNDIGNPDLYEPSSVVESLLSTLPLPFLPLGVVCTHPSDTSLSCIDYPSVG